jgi:hypothetical protein
LLNPDVYSLLKKHVIAASAIITGYIVEKINATKAIKDTLNFLIKKLYHFFKFFKGDVLLPGAPNPLSLLIQ